MIEAFIHIWPYLLITIPLAVAVQMSGAAKYINRAFDAKPVIAILLATIVGAFSPFCSCGVIPVVASLLIGGVPLAPVMAFWIASPSMDPEIFFLSVGTIGWELAVWRLVATLALSLGGGFITHYLVQQGWLGQAILRQRRTVSVQSGFTLAKQGWQRVKQQLTVPTFGIVASPLSNTSSPEATACCATASVATPVVVPVAAGCGDSCSPVSMVQPTPISLALEPAVSTSASSCGSGSVVESTGGDCGSVAEEGQSCGLQAPQSFKQRLLKETWLATSMVVKFMALAFFLEALIILYIPTEWIVGILGPQNPFAIITAALIGVPV